MWFWFFVISAIVNMISLFYIRWLIKTIAVINEDIESVTNLIAEFATHTQQVYELEMFYGDETLRSLLAHSQDVTKQIVDFKIKYSSEDIFEEYEEGEE